MTDQSATSDAPGTDPSADIAQLLRSRAYLMLLVFAALVGVPIAILAYGFLQAVDRLQHGMFVSLPSALGFDGAPVWWPAPVLILGGFIVALAIDRLPGTGGHRPVDGFSTAGAPAAPELGGIIVAALVSLGFGAVVGPEAPLIAIGGGLAALAVRKLARNAPEQATVVIGAAGSFAAVSTLLGSPIVGAFLLMEVVGIAGPMLGVVLVPGLLAAGIGALVFIGLDGITGLGTFSLAVPNIPPFEQVTGAELLWAIAIGILGALVGTAIRRGARAAAPFADRRRLIVTPVLGAIVAAAAIIFDEATGKGVDQVLFSGESALAPLIQESSSWSVGALLALIVCKGVAYAASLAGFRGGPTFPGMLIGAAGGLALAHVGGLPPIAGVAMGIGALAVTMLQLPLTSVLLTTLFLQADGVTLMPLIIISVVVAYVTSARLAPLPPGAVGEGELAG